MKPLLWLAPPAGWQTGTERNMKDRTFLFFLLLILLFHYCHLQVISVWWWGDQEQTEWCDFCVPQVARVNPKDNSYLLRDDFYKHVQRDWPGYSREERRCMGRLLARWVTVTDSHTSSTFDTLSRCGKKQISSINLSVSLWVLGWIFIFCKQLETGQLEVTDLTQLEVVCNIKKKVFLLCPSI